MNKMSENKKLSLKQKIVEIRKAIGILQKETQGQTGKYVDPELILAKVVNAMNEQNVVLTTNILDSESIKIEAPSIKNPDKKDYQTTLKLEMTFYDADSDQSLGIPWYAIGSHMQDPSMAFGTALSYAERYFMLKTFNIATPELDPEFLREKADIVDDLPEEIIQEIKTFTEKKDLEVYYKANLNKTCNKKQFIAECTKHGGTL